MSSNQAVPVARPKPPKRQLTAIESTASSSKSAWTRTQSRVPLTAGVMMFRPWRLKSAPLDVPGTTFSTRMKPASRYFENGVTGRTIWKPASAPASDEIRMLRLPLWAMDSSTAKVPRAPKLTGRQPAGHCPSISSNDALRIRFAAGASAAAFCTAFKPRTAMIPIAPNATQQALIVLFFFIWSPPPADPSERIRGTVHTTPEFVLGRQRSNYHGEQYICRIILTAPRGVAGR